MELIVDESRRRWSREELIVAFNFYCRTPFGKLHSTNPAIIAIARTLNRTPSAVAMKLVNFASLDPMHQERQVRGLQNASKVDRAIWEEFHSDWERLTFESEEALGRLGTHDVASADLPSFTASPSLETERIGETRVRLVQSFFRAAVLASYKCTCAVCRLDIEEVLIASHIIPWAADTKRRADPTNGISLCALHDRAFDRGLFTIDDSFKIRIASRVKKQTASKVQALALVEIDGEFIDLPERFAPDKEALAFHRSNIFRSE